jgi:hypothetical protein
MLRAEGLAAEAIALRIALSLAPVALLALQMENFYSQHLVA